VIAPGAHDEEAIVDTAKNGRATARVIRVGGPAMPYDPTYHLLGRLDKIRGRVRAEKPDVLEVNSPYLAAAGAFASGRLEAGVRTLFWHADHVDTYARPMLERRVSSRVADAMLAPAWAGVRLLASRFDATFAAGKAQVEKLRAHGVPRVHHVPFGVDKDVFAPSARSEERRGELLGAKHQAAHDGAALVVASGRFAVEKRWDVLLDAFCMLRARGVDAVLAIFGDGPEKERMQARVAGRDDVRFVGFEKDRARLASAFASADVFAHSCPYETFGLSVAEATACGAPVVVPDQGGASEGVDRSCAEIYSSLDVEAYAAAIERMLAKRGEALRARTLRAAKKVISVEDHFEDVLDIYRALLGKRNREDTKTRRI
jgi:alpha-1,6-mannosyltransferase